MLFNVPVIDLSGVSNAVPVATEVIHEKILVPSFSLEPPVKAGFLPTEGHYEGTIMNPSTIEFQPIYVLFLPSGHSPPDANDVAETGIEVSAFGSYLEIPKNANLDIWLTTSVAGGIFAYGTYIKRG